MRFTTLSALAIASLLALATAGVGQRSPNLANASAPPPDTVIVIIQKYKYQTGTVTVKAGDVVVWRNLDVTEHTLTADSGAFASPLIKPGERWAFRFATAGTFAYHCTPHPFMKADIHVRKVTP